MFNVNRNPPPALGYCVVCLDLLWTDVGQSWGMHTARVTFPPGIEGLTEDGQDLQHDVGSAAHAVDCYENGGRVTVRNVYLRMRADVVIDDEPRCAEHYRTAVPIRQRALR